MTFLLCNIEHYSVSIGRKIRKNKKRNDFKNVTKKHAYLPVYACMKLNKKRWQLAVVTSSVQIERTEFQCQCATAPGTPH
ncbi:Chitin synthase [Trichinella spiralis]|uniref:Chitin synthase n=1 Tax=Trichinella spiralis TaxID=6334 RepID=A0ABR3KWR5_TRISP